ncbi:molybdopterin converting factor subunit 1 [Mucilaginibacter sp. CSA2-8R]|uniref:molybdopterin converting factor subunit 1 n=1 Tax=Mucilaginibacter sp. CSA2-8R TaxID=3141542 RepID=UPI00315D9435
MKVLLFGITREITGQSRINIPEIAGINTVKALKDWLGQQYPALQSLSSMAVAVDSEYAQDEDALTPEQEIALIPPVSGG